MKTYAFTYMIRNVVPGTCLLSVVYTPADELLTQMVVRIPLPEDYEVLGIEHYINEAAPTHFWASEEESRSRASSLETLVGTQGDLSKEHAPPEEVQSNQLPALEISKFRLEAQTLSKGIK